MSSIKKYSSNKPAKKKKSIKPKAGKCPTGTVYKTTTGNCVKIGSQAYYEALNQGTLSEKIINKEEVIGQNPSSIGGEGLKEYAFKGQTNIAEPILPLYEPRASIETVRKSIEEQKKEEKPMGLFPFKLKHRTTGVIKGGSKIPKLTIKKRTTGMIPSTGKGFTFKKRSTGTLKDGSVLFPTKWLGGAGDRGGRGGDRGDEDGKGGSKSLYKKEVESEITRLKGKIKEAEVVIKMYKDKRDETDDKDKKAKIDELIMGYTGKLEVYKDQLNDKFEELKRLELKDESYLKWAGKAVGKAVGKGIYKKITGKKYESEKEKEAGERFKQMEKEMAEKDIKKPKDADKTVLFDKTVLDHTDLNKIYDLVVGKVCEEVQDPSITGFEYKKTITKVQRVRECHNYFIKLNNLEKIELYINALENSNLIPIDLLSKLTNSNKKTFEQELYKILKPMAINFEPERSRIKYDSLELLELYKQAKKEYCSNFITDEDVFDDDIIKEACYLKLKNDNPKEIIKKAYIDLNFFGEFLNNKQKKQLIEKIKEILSTTHSELIQRDIRNINEEMKKFQRMSRVSSTESGGSRTSSTESGGSRTSSTETFKRLSELQKEATKPKKLFKGRIPLERQSLPSKLKGDVTIIKYTEPKEIVQKHRKSVGDKPTSDDPIGKLRKSSIKSREPSSESSKKHKEEAEELFKQLEAYKPSPERKSSSESQSKATLNLMKKQLERLKENEEIFKKGNAKSELEQTITKRKSLEEEIKELEHKIQGKAIL